MRSFFKYCVDNQLAEVSEDGTLVWKEESDKIDGGRDLRKDLSSDFKGHTHSIDKMGQLKMKAKGGKKAVAPVGK